MATNPHATEIWRAPLSFHLELLHGKYTRERFPSHAHPTPMIGVVYAGAMQFLSKGEQAMGYTGRLMLVNPDVIHSEAVAHHDGWHGWGYYLSDTLWRSLSDELDSIDRLVVFNQRIAEDPALSQQLHALAYQLHPDTPPHDQLTSETEVYTTLLTVLQRYGDSASPVRYYAQEPQAVERIREYLHAHYDEPVTLADLAGLVYLSPYHMVRVFRQSVGTPPHAYLTQLRVQRAAALLRQGFTAAYAAAAVGFADQSHLTRHFKAIVGIPPGKYRKNVQSR